MVFCSVKIKIIISQKKDKINNSIIHVNRSIHYIDHASYCRSSKQRLLPDTHAIRVESDNTTTRIMNRVSFLLACFLIIGRNEIIITGFVAKLPSSSPSSSSSSPSLLPSLSLSPPSPLLIQIGKSSALFETKYDEEYYSHVPAQQASRSRITLSRFVSSMY